VSRCLTGYDVGFQVLTAVVIKNSLFWNTMDSRTQRSAGRYIPEDRPVQQNMIFDFGCFHCVYPAVCIVTGCRLDGRGSIPGMGQDFSILHSVQTGLGARPSSYPIDSGGLFPGIKVARFSN
jgi:hypothetical protein